MIIKYLFNKFYKKKYNMQNEQILFNNNININTNNTCNIRKGNFNNGKQCHNVLSDSEEIFERPDLSMVKNINIYRYKFTNDFTNILFEFAKIHQLDDKETFKEAWKIWIQENDEEIKLECNRLLLNDYKGDIIEKMYKSARYYLRNKSTEKKEPHNRRKYINISKELLEQMDIFINNNKDLKPKISFIEFCNQYQQSIKESIIQMCKNGITESGLIQEKIKKTFKNRYFRFIKNKTI